MDLPPGHHSAQVFHSRFSACCLDTCWAWGGGEAGLGNGSCDMGHLDWARALGRPGVQCASHSSEQKHCLLELGVRGVRELVHNEIYPIIIHVEVTEKNVREVRCAGARGSLQLLAVSVSLMASSLRASPWFLPSALGVWRGPSLTTDAP